MISERRNTAKYSFKKSENKKHSYSSDLLSSTAFASMNSIKMSAKDRAGKGNFRCKRVASEIKRILSEFLLYVEEGLMIAITDVEVSADLSHAKVFVAPISDTINADNCLAFMENIKYKMRNQIGSSIRLKSVPELHFFIDNSFEEGEKIEKILKEWREKREKIED